MSQIRLMIVSPCQNGMTHSLFTISLIRSIKVLERARVSVSLVLQPTGSLLAYERNILLQTFMNSNCTHLLCIDSDIAWEMNAPLKLLNHNKEFVCATYKIRAGDHQGYVITRLSKEEEIHDGDLIKIDKVGFGFVLLKRDAVQKMQNKFSELYFKNEAFDGYGFFSMENINGEFMGEDYAFCHRARLADIDIWCDTNITLNHAGKVGNYKEFLQTKNRE